MARAPEQVLDPDPVLVLDRVHLRHPVPAQGLDHPVRAQKLDLMPGPMPGPGLVMQAPRPVQKLGLVLVRGLMVQVLGRVHKPGPVLDLGQYPGRVKLKEAVQNLIISLIMGASIFCNINKVDCVSAKNK